jgi:uncharacterized delta-60 repeat protein
VASERPCGWTGSTQKNKIARLFGLIRQKNQRSYPNPWKPVNRHTAFFQSALLASLLFLTRITGQAADGDVDNGFNPNANNTVRSFALQANGQILIGGDFTTMGGAWSRYIARLNADGTLDSFSHPNVSGNPSLVYSILAQVDGRVLIGGFFQAVNGNPRYCIARLNADGTLDNGFSPNANGFVHSTVMQADGKILIGGDFTTAGGAARNHIARLNADGTLDNSFDPNANAQNYSIAVQEDGKILIGGMFTAIGGTARNYVARLNADGTLDNSFDPNVGSFVWGIAVQVDGKILIGGSFTNVSGTGRNYIARLNPDGTLDNGFDPNANAKINTIVLQADGKILIGGDFTTVGGTTRNHIARLNSDGTPDTSFDPNANNSVAAIVLQGDGQVLIGGDFSTVGGTVRNHIARLLNTTATQTISIPDSTRVQWLRSGTAPEVQQVTFDLSMDGGITWTALGSGARISGGWELAGLSLPLNGSIRARGRATGGYSNGSSGLIEQVQGFYGSAPTLMVYEGGDPLTNGVATVDFGALPLGQAPGAPLSFTISNSGPATVVLSTVAVTGDAAAEYNLNTNGMATTLAPGACTTASITFAPAAEDVRRALLQITSQGQEAMPLGVALTGTRLRVDASFNPAANNAVFSSVAQVDGKILVGGAFTSVSGTLQSSIARLNADGTIDTSLSLNVYTNVFSLAVQTDGKILMGGMFSTVAGAYLARLNADGTLDSNFNPNANNVVFCSAVQADGRALIGGTFSYVGGMPRNGIARLNADGTVDSSFNPNAYPAVSSLAVQTDGRILIGGYFNYLDGIARKYIGRLNADGTLDSNFNPNANTNVYSIALQADGKILIGGDFTTVGGTARNHIARLNADGTVDSSFNPNVNAYVYSIVVQADGKILIGGGFTTVGGTTRNNIARLNSDGTLESGFNPNPNGAVYSITEQADGEVLIGGAFTAVNGTAHNGIARLLNPASTQTLSTPDNSRVRWLRSGTTPEVQQVTFELSTNGGSTWAALGSGTRISGGWELTGLSLPLNGSVRARGRATGGQYNGSSSLIEQVGSFAFPDTVPPVLTCPPDVTVYADSGQCYASGVALGTPTASDNSGTVTVSSNAPTRFALGTNTVVWTATDPSSNSTTCSQQVIVLEAAPPTVTCPANMTVQSPAFRGVAVNFPLTINGGCSPLTLYCAPPSGGIFPIGSTVVTATLVDGCGVTNSSSFTVTVLAPPVTLSTSASDAGRVLTWPFGVLQASDRVNGTYTNVPNATSPFTITPIGSPQYYYRVKVQ